MFRLVADAGLQAEVLRVVRFAHRSACAASRICDCFGCGGGGRLGDNLIIQSFSVFGKIFHISTGLVFYCKGWTNRTPKNTDNFGTRLIIRCLRVNLVNNRFFVWIIEKLL
jgi:hypothetical protein